MTALERYRAELAELEAEPEPEDTLEQKILTRSIKVLRALIEKLEKVR